MKTQDLDKIQGATVRDTIRLRRNAIKQEQENLNPPRVPRADPPTTTGEVPPGFANIRAVPTKRTDGSTPEPVQISNVEPTPQVQAEALDEHDEAPELRELAQKQAEERRQAKARLQGRAAAAAARV